jgi:hypothetical protein
MAKKEGGVVERGSEKLRNLHVIAGLGLFAIGGAMGSTFLEALGAVEGLHAGALELLRRHQERRRLSKNIGRVALDH